MILAKITGGAVAAYPYSSWQLRADHPDTSFPAELDGIDLADFGAAAVEPGAPPACDAEHRVEESQPVLSGGRWVQTWQVVARSAEELAAHQAALLAQVDSEAGAFRLHFITETPGQAQTYDAKATEAAAWTAAADPQPQDFPFLSAEAAACAMTIGEVAAIITATTAQWTALAARIEGARMAAKRAIQAASTFAAMDAAAAVDWEGLLV
ncbi:hypothetical protein FHS51_001732 [Sphingobium wenxiniae]|uniref:DUF4376 domain-containing protein n=1 Tax=Sphingobium wenxiniae (strain DSM 21828 / CGMCC 1.7748 / JZ-1) TaxID=595605 RepID=A0A562KDB6_SPHWJ|nr:hypothetical protein [Sphingobium wenxiniae]MBB6191505.1 hypothetical protein [Sphingobium wenxiniae]TWH93205.1 hypothetical protein IQ35_02112 [Sphingobium wenxiniae]